MDAVGAHGEHVGRARGCSREHYRVHGHHPPSIGAMFRSRGPRVKGFGRADGPVDFPSGAAILGPTGVAIGFRNRQRPARRRSARGGPGALPCHGSRQCGGGHRGAAAAGPTPRAGLQIRPGLLLRPPCPRGGVRSAAAGWTVSRGCRSCRCDGDHPRSACLAAHHRRDPEAGNLGRVTARSIGERGAVAYQSPLPRPLLPLPEPLLSDSIGSGVSTPPP